MIIYRKEIHLMEHHREPPPLEERYTIIDIFNDFKTISVTEAVIT